MKVVLRLMLFAMSFFIAQAGFAQSKTITGRITSSDDGSPMPGVSVVLKGTTNGASTDGNGQYSIQAPVGGVLVYSFIGTISQERTVGAANTIDIVLRSDSKALDEVVVTALGIEERKAALGYAITEVKGADVAQTQRENFVNALAGRVAGVEVASTSGLPGASASITIRGVSSLSGSNQPLFVVDGLPVSNNSFSTHDLASATTRGLENRGVDFGNRASDINPEDIETITVLKGPEASALYGIDAASGAIVITTKRGKVGAARINYNNSFRMDRIVKFPEIQRVYNRGTQGVTDEGSTITTYFGEPYGEDDVLYDNVKNFFQTSTSQRHNLSLSGGTDASTYRISTSYIDAGSFIPNTGQQKFSLSSAVTSKLSKYISTDVSFAYTYSDVQSTFTVGGGPMLGLLAWPSNDDASNYLDENGDRRFFSASTTGTELENPFFTVNKNPITNTSDRYITNAKIVLDPVSWFKFVGNVGFDYFTQNITMVRHPQSVLSAATGGIFDQTLNTSRNLNIQYYGQFTKGIMGDKINFDFKVGSAINDQNRFSQSSTGQKFLAPDLFSIENTDPVTHRGRNRLTQRRLVGVFSSLGINYKSMLYLNFTGRNDWSSTLPKANNSFFYPSASLSFVFTELAPLAGIKNVLSFGKLRASAAQVGKDADPYMIRPWLEPRTTTGGGFGYAFNGPAEALVPEMTTSYELGGEVKFFNDRLGVDFAYFRKVSKEQIVRGMRLSYGTGFVLKTFNAGQIETGGYEFQINATPLIIKDFVWDMNVNYSHNYSELVKLPPSIPEYYNSDTWLYGNVRNGARIGGPVNSFTGFDYQRNNKGQVLISPTTGYPLRDVSEWKVIGDRTPDFTMGVGNKFTYKGLSLDFLFEIRKGGDVFNATEHFLTVRGLSMRTLDRFTPKVYQGVLADGLENTDNPTENNIVINPATDPTYFSSTLVDYNFVEKDVNWLRLRDVTLRYNLPTSLLQSTKIAKSASIFVTGTDLFIITNYSGLDPVGSATSLATGGSGGYGFDYGNMPMPMGLNVGINIGF